MVCADKGLDYALCVLKTNYYDINLCNASHTLYTSVVASTSLDTYSCCQVFHGSGLFSNFQCTRSMYIGAVD